MAGKAECVPNRQNICLAAECGRTFSAHKHTRDRFLAFVALDTWRIRIWDCDMSTGDPATARFDIVTIGNISHFDGGPSNVVTHANVDFNIRRGQQHKYELTVYSKLPKSHYAQTHKNTHESQPKKAMPLGSKTRA